MLNRMMQIAPEKLSTSAPDKGSRAVAAFVESYFTHSRIDPRWKPILQVTARHPATLTLIATDHYAEATQYVINHLDELEISAAAATDGVLMPADNPVIVANSSDLGAHKSKLDFWRILKEVLKLEAVPFILLIDDFGFNEQVGDHYSNRKKMEIRKQDTIQHLKRVFSAQVEAISFLIEAERLSKASDCLKKTDAIFGLQIKAASKHIDRYLNAHSH
jgi:hypothetical protein